MGEVVVQAAVPSLIKSSPTSSLLQAALLLFPPSDWTASHSSISSTPVLCCVLRAAFLTALGPKWQREGRESYHQHGLNKSRSNPCLFLLSFPDHFDGCLLASKYSDSLLVVAVVVGVPPFVQLCSIGRSFQF